MTKLLPCPFCGEDCAYITTSKYGVDRKRTMFWVSCDNCYLSYNNGPCGTKELAVEKWNTRTPDPRLKEVIKDIKHSISRMEKAKISANNKTAYMAMLGVAKGTLDIIYKHIPEAKK